MPHPKGKIKMSGDVHLPDAESDLDLEEGENDLAELGKDRRQPRGAAQRVRDGGVLAAGSDQDSRIGSSPRSGANATRPARPAAPRRPQPASTQAKDPRGLAAAFREPAVHAAHGVAATARSASPWAVWSLGLLAALLIVRKLR